MNSVVVSAPGKAVLCGEYAVLRNAPAISVAVGRRATVRLATTENKFHVVTTPGYEDGEWRFTTSHGGEIEWLDELPDQGLRLIEEAWRVCRPRTGDHLDFTIDSADFFDSGSGRKLGLGGSAATMSALVGAISELFPQSENVATLAAKAHKGLQHDVGSGVDVATCCYGGVIEFRMDTPEAPLRHSWPGGLGYRFLWSGSPVDTGSKIRKLEDGSDSEKDWDLLLTAAEAAASAWKRANVTEILECH